MGNLKQKGKAINFVAPAGWTVIKGELYRVDAWNHIALSTVLPTDPELGYAGEVSEDIWYVQLPSGLTANKGDILSWPNANATNVGILSLTTGSAHPACKVEEAVDANNIAGIRVLNIS